MKRDIDAELRRYLAGERVPLRKTLRAFRKGHDIALATAAVLKNCVKTRFRGARDFPRLPAAVIRGVLAVPGDELHQLLLRLAVDLDASDAKVEAAWQRATGVLGDLETSYAWGSKPRRAKLLVMARDRVLIAAIQGTVAHCADVPRDLLAVLAIDGSDASIDALVPHLERAFVEQGEELDDFVKLRTHAAKTPRMRELFAQIERSAAERTARSPARSIDAAVGFPEGSLVFFHATLVSRDDTVRGDLRFDSRRAKSFRVWLGGTRFDATELHLDKRKLGRCEPAELGPWLARAAKKLRVQWEVPRVRTNLRGSKRDALARWLTGS